MAGQLRDAARRGDRPERRRGLDPMFFPGGRTGLENFDDADNV